MTEILLFLGGAAVGGLLTLVLLRVRMRGAGGAERESAALTAQLSAASAVEKELREQVRMREMELGELRVVWQQEASSRAAADAQAREAAANLEQQRELLRTAEQRLRESFAALSHESLQKNSETFVRAADEKVRPLKEALDKLDVQVRAVEQARQEAYGRVVTQLEQLGKLSTQLSQQTAGLVTALRTPHVRGRWGEVTLKRAVEVAGLSPHCDFDTQATVGDEENRQRPDLTVRLPGGRTIVVDAKAPLAGYLDALETPDEVLREAKLVQHARQLRAHLAALSAKRYWQQFQQTPDFVVLFVPGESFFSAAIERDRTLLEDGIADRVILATPTTLIALLRTVAYTWQQNEVVENAQEIGRTARELFDRVCTFGGHLAKLGENLKRATDSFNDAAGSWERRTLPMAARLKDLGATTKDAELPLLTNIDAKARALPESVVRVQGEG